MAVDAAAIELRLWRSWDACFAVVAICTNLLPLLPHRHWTSALALGPAALALCWAFVCLGVLQLLWVVLLPSTYTVGRRTAFMVLQRSLRVAMVAAAFSDERLVASLRDGIVAASRSKTPAAAALTLCIGVPRVLVLHSVVCFLPLPWSLPFLLASLAVALRLMAPALAQHLADPRFAPGTEQLTGSACHVLSWVSGLDPSIPQQQSPLCRDLTPGWLAVYSVLLMGLVVPVAVQHLLEHALLPHVRSVLAGGEAKVDVLECVLMVVLLHVPLLMLVLLSMVVVATIFMMPRQDGLGQDGLGQDGLG